MAQNFIPLERDQPMLLPPDLRDWLPEDHLAWFILDAVSELDLGQFFSDYRDDGWGRAAHDPEMMVALLLYARSPFDGRAAAADSAIAAITATASASLSPCWRTSDCQVGKESACPTAARTRRRAWPRSGRPATIASAAALR